MKVRISGRLRKSARSQLEVFFFMLVIVLMLMLVIVLDSRFSAA